MPASIWLQPDGLLETRLQRIIQYIAQRNGTVVFRPHLTICAVPDPAALDAAAAYVRECALLPLMVAKTAVTGAVITPFRAVFIEVEEAPPLRQFRERLRAITGAPEPPPPHISLLYTLDEGTQQPRSDLDAATLPAIAAECAARIPDQRLSLGRAVVHDSGADLTNVRGWRIIREL